MLNESQQAAYKAMCSGENIFLTGGAGTGKSYLLRKFIAEHENRTIVCAPTGVAANNIRGATLHRAFNISASPCPDPGNKHVKLLSGASTVVIDEISMCRIDVFDYVCTVLQNMEIRENRHIQLIVCGDFAQLPPVITEKDRPILTDHYGHDAISGYCFQSTLWGAQKFHTFVLTDPMRQADMEFVRLLNEVRDGNPVAFTTLMGKCSDHTESDDVVSICDTNAVAEKINNEHLNRITTLEYTFDAVVTGTATISDVTCLGKLKLKVGCRVMCLVNLPEIASNGEMGTVTSINYGYTKTYGYVVIGVRWDSGVESEIDQYTWTIYGYKSIQDADGKPIVERIEIGTVTQYPVKLAYAVTVHKSQGIQYDAANILVTRPFATGQLYTAISRVKKIDGLYLDPEIKLGVMTDPVVIKFYATLLEQNDPEVSEPAENLEPTKKRGRGRPSEWDGRATTVVRIPTDIVDQVIAYAHSIL